MRGVYLFIYVVQEVAKCENMYRFLGSSHLTKLLIRGRDRSKTRKYGMETYVWMCEVNRFVYRPLGKRYKLTSHY